MSCIDCPNVSSCVGPCNDDQPNEVVIAFTKKEAQELLSAMKITHSVIEISLHEWDLMFRLEAALKEVT